MKSHVTECGKYIIESLSAATFPGALQMIRDYFCQDETVSIGTEVNKNPVAIEELLELCADAALDGVSVVAIDVESGEVVAASFNKIQISNSIEKPFFEIFAEERCTQPSSRALVQFMADVDEKCNFFEKYNVDCSFEIMFIATNRIHRNKKLGTLLFQISINIAKELKDGPVSTFTIQDLGPKYSTMKARAQIDQYPKIVQAIATTEATSRIGRTLGFTVHLRISFEEFTYNNKSYVERLGRLEFCEAIAKKLY